MAAIASTSATFNSLYLRKSFNFVSGRSEVTRNVFSYALLLSSKSQNSKSRTSWPAVRASVAVAPSATLSTPIKYSLPTWAQFELGLFPVFWETPSGRPPASGEQVTLWLNPSATGLDPSLSGGMGFNGGFNSPVMCGGDPRLMSKKERGPNCQPFYTIKVNVPLYCTHMEFSFTDGLNWEGPYSLDLEIPAKWRNQPASFFNEGLQLELGQEGACDAAIFPEANLIMDRCVMPSTMLHAESARCDLDIVPGCTDPESPFFDPLATRDDGSCPIDTSDNTI